MNFSKHNTFCLECIEQLIRELERLSSDRFCLGVVLTGNERSFCTGLDLDSMVHSGYNDFCELMFRFDTLLFKVYSFNKPLCAYVTGHAIGGGLALSMATLYSIVSDLPKIKIGFPEYALGIGMTPFMINLVRNMGLIHTAWIYSGEYLTPSEATRMGIFSVCTSDDGVSKGVSFIKKNEITSNEAFILYQEQIRPPLCEPVFESSTGSYGKMYNRLSQL